MDMSAGAVFVAGLLTFLSPCVLPVVPIYLSILAGEGTPGNSSRWRVLAATATFVLGFSLVFVLLGLSSTAIGALLVRHKLLLQQIGGVVVVLLGLRFLGWLRIPGLEGSGAAGLAKPRTRFHFLNTFLLGILFALAWSPCIGSVLGAVLTYTALATSNALEGMGLLALYSLGFAVPLLILAAFAGPALSWLRRAKRFMPMFERVTGAMLIAIGLLLVTDQLGVLDLPGSDMPATALVAAPTVVDEAVVDGAGACSEDGASQCGVSEPVAMPTLIEFYSPSCTICMQMIPTMNALKNDCRGRGVRIRQVDVSTPEGRLLARQNNVRGIPVFLFLDAEGRESARLVGMQKLEALERQISVLTGEECEGYRRLPEL